MYLQCARECDRIITLGAFMVRVIRRPLFAIMVNGSENYEGIHIRRVRGSGESAAFCLRIGYDE